MIIRLFLNNDVSSTSSSGGAWISSPSRWIHTMKSLSCAFCPCLKNRTSCFHSSKKMNLVGIYGDGYGVFVVSSDDGDVFLDDILLHLQDKVPECSFQSVFRNTLARLIHD